MAIDEKCNKWNKIQKELWNANLTYDQNNRNGCNLPPKEGMPVLIYDSDKPRYLVGSIMRNINNPNALAVYESVKGDIYSGVDYIKWQEFNFIE